MTTADVYGVEIVKGLVAVGVIVGLLSGKNWCERFLSVFVASLILLMTWPVAGGVVFVLVNLGAEAVEAIRSTEVDAQMRLLIAKIGTFAFLVFFCAKHVWEELNTPASVPRGRAVFGPARSVFRKVAYK